MKALLHYRASLGFRRALAQAAEAAGIDTVIVEETDVERFERELADTDLLLHALEPVTDAMLAKAPRLKLIQKIGVGVNTIDLEAAKARGIAVCNMPGSNSQAVAEMTLLLMLAVLRKTVWVDAQTRAGRGWSLELDALDDFGEIGGRTVGFVGFGAIPQRLAPALEALGARVIYTTRGNISPRPELHRSFDDLLAEADILTLHAPLTEQTRHLIDAATLARMRPGAILINAARGELVDETALADALKSGQLRGAGLDVFAREPIGEDHPLAALGNVVLTPHVAWLTPETLDRCLAVAMDNAGRLARGEPLVHRVV